MADRQIQAAGHEPPDLAPRSEIALLGADVGNWMLGELLLLLRRQSNLERVHDRSRHALLDVEHVVQRAPVLVGPELDVVRRVHQPRRDPQAVRRAPHAALEHVPAAEVSADGREAARIALETHRRGSRDHAQRPDPRQIGDDLVGQSVAEVLGVGIRAQVRERQHDDRLRVGRRVRGCDEPGVRERPERVSHLAEITQAIGNLAHKAPFDDKPDLPRDVGR